MTRFFTNMLEIFGIVFLRFRPMPRLWCIWLVGVNAAAVLFLPHAEAVVVLCVTLLAVLAQTVMYRISGFTRILGTAHMLWLPMFAWMATRLDVIAQDRALAVWLGILAVTNAVSMAVDLVDAVRFLRGERAPHYSWRRVALA